MYHTVCVELYSFTYDPFSPLSRTKACSSDFHFQTFNTREEDSIPIFLLDMACLVSLEELTVFIYLFCVSPADINNAVTGEGQAQSSKLQNIEKVMAVKYITILHRIYEALTS